MTNPSQAPIVTLAVSLSVASLILMFACVLMLSAQPAHAQTYNILHTFSGCADGDAPNSTMTLDEAGRLYGATPFGGSGVGSGCGDQGRGVIFRLERHGSGWVFAAIHTFMGGPADGYEPSGLTIGPNGLFYGTTAGGGEYGGGTVFQLQPPPNVCPTVSCPWGTALLRSFTDDNYGYALGGNVTFDSAGNLYGSTGFRDGNPDGVIFELTNSGGTWTIQALWSFFNETYVMGGLALDSAGNLYGASYSVFSDCGTIFELSRSGSSWVFNTLYSFTCGSDGGTPEGTPVLDQAGNLYGTTHSEGAGGGGTVFELSPSGGGWNFSLLYSFVGQNGGPGSALTMDAAGNLYGTTVTDGAHSQGNVFKLTRNGSSWTYTDLYDFGSQQADGTQPWGGVTLDSSGNLYGTTSAGGTNGAGVVWEITP